MFSPILLCDDNGRGEGRSCCWRGLDLQPTIGLWLNDWWGLSLSTKVLDSIQPIIILRLELERGINNEERNIERKGKEITYERKLLFNTKKQSS